MSLFRSLLFCAVVVGLIVGGVVTVFQRFGTVPLILQGEVYEEAAREAVPHEHAAPVAAAPDAGHRHPVAAWEPANGLERDSYTALANILTATGFALVLAAVFALRGHDVGWREGLFWGLGGFAVFTLAPGLGLPPELPGVPAAALASRQIWWVATACATSAGLALLVFRRAPWAAVLGVALIAMPHVAGAPHLAGMHSNIPEALARQFVAAVTVTSLVFWALLGSLTATALGRWFPVRL